MYRCFKRVVGVGTGNYVYFWKSKGLSDESITPPPTSDYSLNPQLSYFGSKIRVTFRVCCLKQDKLTYTNWKTVNIYILYELTDSRCNRNDPTLKNSLFGADKLTKNAYIEKNGSSSYRIGFDTRGSFSFPGGRFGSNIIVFGVDMSSSVHLDNKKKDILILEKCLTQALEHALTSEKMYSIDFTKVD